MSTAFIQLIIQTKILEMPLCNPFSGYTYVLYIDRFMYLFQNLKWRAPSRWLFSPNSAWSRIETTSIEKTHPTLSLDNKNPEFYVIGSLVRKNWIDKNLNVLSLVGFPSILNLSFKIKVAVIQDFQEFIRPDLLQRFFIF